MYRNKEEASLKIVGLSGSITGSKTRTAMDCTIKRMIDNNPNAEVTLLDLKDYDIQFSDGRNYLEYDGDTGYVVETIMAADIVIIGTPIFQASIPAPLKNIFDLLPENAFLNKIVGLIVTAGSAKHFLVAEQQIKPILSYMKAHIVQTYVFIEEQDFYQKKITNDDVLLRIDRLVEDIVVLAEAFHTIREEKEAEYGF